MKLWYFTLGINRDEGIYRARAGQPAHQMYDANFISDFSYETRSFCNYLARAIRKCRFETDGFRQIAIKASLEPRDELFLDNSHNVRTYVQFDFDHYQSIPKTRRDLNEYFITLITNGLDRVAKDHAIPYTEYMQNIDAFREAGYVNEWVLKARSFRDLKLKCEVLVSFDINRVTLTLVVTRSKQEIFREEILRTKPDEIHFMKEIKDIVLLDGVLALVDPIWGKPVWSKPISEIV